MESGISPADMTAYGIQLMMTRIYNGKSEETMWQLLTKEEPEKKYPSGIPKKEGKE